MLTDNLAPFVRSPQRDDAAAFLSPLGFDLQSHDTLWGGAIQFIRADGGSTEPPPPMQMGPPPGVGGPGSDRTRGVGIEPGGEGEGERERVSG